MVRFRFLGIQVNVEPWFWLTMAFIGGGLSAKTSQDFLQLALFIMAGFVSILIHEMGHALMIRRFGLPTQVTLTTFGGYAAYPAGILSRAKSFVVTAAGPAIQFAFGLLMLLVVFNYKFPSNNIGYFFEVLAGISLIWSVFNCLPIFPLDGGQMLGAILGPQRAKGLHLTGVIFAVGIGLLGVFWGQPLIAIFMGLFAWQNYQIFKQTS